MDDNRSSERFTEIWNHDQFRDRILNAVKTHDIPKAEWPAKIDLAGKLGQTFDSLHSQTLADPRKREHGCYAKVSPEGKMLISQIMVGEEKQFNATVSLHKRNEWLYPPHYAKHEYMALTAHSHGVEDVPHLPLICVAYFCQQRIMANRLQ